MTYEQRGWDGPRGQASTVALSWIAGFLEGEGSFVGCESGGQITVSAVQLQREPLDRVQIALGGTIRPYVNKRGTLVYRWTINGSHAIGVAFTLYTFMSPRRREQIRKMVAIWKGRPGKNNRLKTRCPRGHEYTPENIYLMSGRRRACRQCYVEFYGKQVVNGNAPQPLDPGGTPGE